ncbi:glutamine-hydrolyzing GMP synthase [Pontiella agarivorans]|uniref:GMP synthase [glutamine-hydrolyzing] n=1 Tax=Pontiella agarivorans TaxID=3038953 RepID=A0ABU5MTE9_9BACT|nr:glutamine-hydrolyzing GMP synthase [Pontiella agarivorans]MDZ8117473.1 glutamine-hydrolyzing GMP synthase [Pontiella agarivorans]
MNHPEWIAILDYGSQVTQLIARRLREQKVYCEIIRFDTPADELKKRSPKGIILSGGPCSVPDEDSPKCDPAIFDLGLPILGICYGMQLTALTLGGSVHRGTKAEYGKAMMSITKDSPLFKGLSPDVQVWMSHGDKVESMPKGFEVVAQSDNCPLAAIQNLDRNIFGVQFHPEVVHTPQGKEMLWNFAFKVCQCSGDWEMSKFIENTVKNIQNQVGDDHVLLGLSGGVDSSVVAALLHKAIGDQLHCVYVDNGLMRHKETEEIEELFGNAFGIDLTVAHAGDLFLGKLEGISDPEEKRKIIGNTFIDVFAEKARGLSDKVKFLGQGTLYPDVIESVSPIGGPSATIKSHHNVGGLPEDLQFELVEPLRELFKDEVREVGRELGLPSYVVDRQPFPGPGLAVRIIGDITPERIDVLQQADLRVREEIMKMPNHLDVWQYFAVLLPIQSVGVMGDDRTYENVVAVRAVESRDGMTADWYKLPYDVMDSISNRIINEVRGVNRVCYDISSKPPSTIEWE